MNRVDPSALTAALAEANLAVLVSALAHLTGDLTLIDRHPDPRQFDHGRGPGTLPPAEAEAIRAEAVAVLGAPDGPVARPAVDEASLHRIMEFCAGEEVAPEYVPLVEEEANFDGDDRRRFVWRRVPDDAVRRSFRVGIIGAGLGGLCAAIRLEQAGIPYTVFEKNPDVGGTWYENTYPDLRVDVPNHFYSYSFRPNPDWSHYFARRDELAEYIETCAKEYGVLPNVRCCTEVLAADYDERRGRWAVQLCGADGTEERIEVDALISAVGMLSRPSIPDLPGLDAFAGPWFHSARWDHDVDLKGRRVAVVGTGASAMQFVPAIAPDVEQLTIFQRSRHWVTPNPNYHRAVTDAEKWLFHHVPYYEGWYRFLNFWNSADRMYPAFRVDPDWPEPDRAVSRPNDKLRRVMTTHIERELAARPELVDEVLPDYPALGKRMLQDNGWYRALLRDNVTLVNERIVVRGTGRGRHHVGPLVRGRRHRAGDRVPAQQVPVADADHRPRRRARRPLGRGPAGVPRHHRARVPEPLLPLRAEHQPGGRQRHRRSWSAKSTTSSKRSARCSRTATPRWSAARTCTTPTTSGSTPSTSTSCGATRACTATTTTARAASPRTCPGSCSTTGA